MVPLRGQECEPLAYLRLSSGEPLPKKYEGEQNKMTRNGCRRRLDTAELAEDFISKTFENGDDIEKIAMKIVQAEIELAKLESSPTKTHTSYRNKDYRDDWNRERLCNQILSELINYEQLNSDDDICLGVGGAKPKEPWQESVAYIVSGAPASGKSSIADALAHENGAYILDSDYAKRKFPEYMSYNGGASLVHAESNEIIFGSEDRSNSLLEYCIYSQCNIVIPLVGRTQKSVEKICARLIEAQYKIHLINVALDRYKCTQRAYRRFLASKRYVPLSYVFDEVGNEPELVYFRLKRAHEADYESFSQLSTDVPKGELPKVIEKTENSPY